MDVSDINKVANRKRMNTDAEKLREKVSRETAKIIKLKVAQDTAYWDLKEKLQQLEANHERLQRNMVDVQMQHEAVSGQFQEELRLRPDTLNKLNGTRDICDALEEYGSRLRRSVARCRADQQALGAAYGACGARVRRLAERAERARAQLREQRQAERRAAERDEARVQQLVRAREQLAEARARAAALDADLERCSADSRRAAAAAAERDELAAQLRRARDDLRAQSEAARERLAALECELAEARRAGADCRAVLEQRARDLQEAVAAVQRIEAEFVELSDQKKEMENVLGDRDQLVRTLELEVSRAKEESSRLETEKLELRERLTEAERQGEIQASRLQELSRRVHDLESDLTEGKEAHAIRREADARRIEELNAVAAEKSRELDAKTATVARLMADLKGEAQARYRADAALEAARREHGAERERLQAALRDKDAELASQLAVLLDARSEKARLQEQIGGMQATIDNVRKELTGPAPPPPPPAERDEPAPKDDLLYGFLSDGSVDGDALDAREVGRRFCALARGGGGAPLSLSQLKKDLKMKRRTFFKSKRLENDSRKLKE